MNIIGLLATAATEPADCSQRLKLHSSRSFRRIVIDSLAKVNLRRSLCLN